MRAALYLQSNVISLIIVYKEKEHKSRVIY